MTRKSMRSGGSLRTGCPQVPAWWHGAVQPGPISPEQVMYAGRALGRDAMLPEIAPRE